MGSDGDPLDALVLHPGTTAPGTLIECRLLGVLEVRQTERGRTIRNDRYALYPSKLAARDRVRSLRDLKDVRREELEEFFRQAVAGTGKRLSFLGWKGATVARREIQRSAVKPAREAPPLR